MPVVESAVEEMDSDLAMIDGNMTDDMMGSNMTDMPMTNDEVPVDQEEVPECDEIEESFCDVFGGGLDECCLTDCTAEIQNLLTCVVLQTTGEDRSDCSIPTCPGAAPPMETTAPNPGTSSATSVVTRVAAVATTLAAVAMM